VSQVLKKEKILRSLTKDHATVSNEIFNIFY